MIWLSSDFHFFHKNVIKMCGRPFQNLHEMHETIISNWNDRVKSNENAYILGDVGMCGYSLLKHLIPRMNGNKILILGNHDKAAHRMLEVGFQEVKENIWIEIGNRQKIFLSHYPFHPMSSFQKFTDEDGQEKIKIEYLNNQYIDMRYMHKRMVNDGNSWLIHGHVHNAWIQNGKQINVGCDVWDFKPVSHEKILQMIERGPQLIYK
jgi:calcineurin-like phosphoesterase family protein